MFPFIFVWFCNINFFFLHFFPVPFIHHRVMSSTHSTVQLNQFTSIDKTRNKQEERQARLREHARRLIAETRAKSHNLDSPTSPIKLITHRITLSPERTISPINTTDGFFTRTSKDGSPVKQLNSPRITPPRDKNGFSESDSNKRSSPSKRNERNGNSPLQSFNSVLDRISPQREKKVGDVISFFLFICMHLDKTLALIRRYIA